MYVKRSGEQEQYSDASILDTIDRSIFRHRCVDCGTFA